MKDTTEIVVITDNSGCSIIQTVGANTFKDYRYISSNRIEVREIHDHVTTFNISPHNEHALNAFERWSK